MEAEEYRIKGKQLVDYLADYLTTIRDRKVVPNRPPGFIFNAIPDSAPSHGESWEDIIKDFSDVILPGITHWQSPHMHAYFPALNSYPAMLAGMLMDAINCITFTWAACPAGTELEMVTMNWLGKMIGLPDEFLFVSKKSKGGGVIQTTASEATLVSLLAARFKIYEQYEKDPDIISKLVAYCSDQAHSSVEKAALVGFVQVRFIESDHEYSMRGEKLKEAIELDRKDGLIPFWVCATLGTTGSCAFDNLDEIGLVCREEDVWLHVDAAYAGTAFVCPEFRGWMKGIERVDSVAFNPSKWMLTCFDCTAMWVKSSNALHKALVVNPVYLQHPFSDYTTDYMHWQIPLSRRFRALKLWFVIRNYGIIGIQKHVRKSVDLARCFEKMVRKDERFEIPSPPHLGLIVFRLVGDNSLTEKLLKRINATGSIHCVPAYLKCTYVIRFTVTSQHTTVEDIEEDWRKIQDEADVVVQERDEELMKPRIKVPLAETKERNEHFGTSLLLTNTPMSPKIVNGSFAAMYHEHDVLVACEQAFCDSTHRSHKRLDKNKQFSLDSNYDFIKELGEFSGLVSPSRDINSVEDDFAEYMAKFERGNRTHEDTNNEQEFFVAKRNRSKSIDQQKLQRRQMRCSKCGHIEE